MIDTTTKPRRFYRNLLDWGFRLEVDQAGQLVVTTPPAVGEDLYGWLPAAAGRCHRAARAAPGEAGEA
jgi:hypothetical protein